MLPTSAGLYLHLGRKAGSPTVKTPSPASSHAAASLTLHNEMMTLSDLIRFRNVDNVSSTSARLKLKIRTWKSSIHTAYTITLHFVFS